MKIDFFFISPAHQGKKIGAGVMGLVEGNHPKVRKWSLVTPYKDFRNHYFYEKYGYTKVGEWIPDENSEFTLFQYEKIIK